MKRYIITLGILWVLFTFNAQSGTIIGGTRVIYAGEKKEASISVRNPEKSDVYLIQSWVETGPGKGKSPFIVTPPLFRINPGEENILRIVRTGGTLPQDRESVFWLNVKSVPAISDDQPRNNVLQVVVKTRLKLFYRPDGLGADAMDAYRRLTFSATGYVLTVTNPTPWYVTLYALNADGQEIKEADMVPPKGSVSFTLLSVRPRIVTWQAINDYGGISESESRTL